MSNCDLNCGVVVTGMGVVTPIGIGSDRFWDSLIAGRSGIRCRQEFAHTGLPLRFHAPVEGFDGKLWVKPRKALKVMCEPIQYGYAAAAMAADQAGIQSAVQDGNLATERMGTVFGSETFFSHPANVADVFGRCVVDGVYQHDKWGEAAMRAIEPLWMLKYLPNMVTSHVSIAMDARGPSNTICQREVSGLLALIEGMEWIRRGICDAVVVGGTGSCTSITVNLYHGTDLVRHSSQSAVESCRPFELNREGTIYGEGAGAILLESEELATSRNAEILCRIGAASRNFCPPESDAFTDCMADNMVATIQRSEIGCDHLGHVNAHGLGSRHWDSVEANAIQNVFPQVPTIALKSYFGYLGAGSSIVELIGSILALQHGQLPATLNYQEPDPACPCNVNASNAELKKLAAIKLAYSIHGQIVSVVVVRP